MIKKNKAKIILTALITIIPMIAGIILWDILPEILPTHWGIDNQIDGYSSKAMVVFGIPLFMLAIHLICIACTSADPRKVNINPKMLWLVLWICPIMSLLCEGVIYCTALGFEVDVSFVICFVMGAIFTVLGNYMPKCRQNFTVGIRIPWTLASEENWNKTHRLAGGLWVAGGILIMLTAFLRNFWVFFAILMAISIIPIIYSYVHYKKSKKQ